LTLHEATATTEHRDLFLLLDDIQEFLLEMRETAPMLFAETIENWLIYNEGSGSRIAAESPSLHLILEDALLRLYDYYSLGGNTPDTWRRVTEFCRACLNDNRVQFARSADANTNHQENAAWSNALATASMDSRQLWNDAPEPDIDADSD
jgi:hypothetical protein